MANAFLLFIAFILVLANGFFVAAEFAMVKLRETRVHALKRTYHLRGKILHNVHNHIDSYLSACQLGITLTSLGLGWIGEPAMAKALGPVFQAIGLMSQTTITLVSFTIAFCLISIFHIVLGELVPKSIAIRSTESISLWTAVPLYIFYKVMYPAIWSLNCLANLILQLFGYKTEQKLQEKGYSPEEFKFILSSGHLREAFSEEEVEVLKHVIDFSDLKLGDLLRPMDEMIALPVNVSIKEALDRIAQHQFSRYPVYENEPDNIIGVLHIKDILVAMQRLESEDIEIRDLLRPIIVTHQDQLASELFAEFRSGQVHFAVVKNKIDNVVGFITLDNIIKTLLGTIRDEFNIMKPEWLVTASGVILMRGNTPVYALERALNIEIPTQANTISGLLMSHLERLPNPKERIHFPKFEVVVQRIQGPRILLVKIYPKHKGGRKEA